jgi:hypothetical protein
MPNEPSYTARQGLVSAVLLLTLEVTGSSSFSDYLCFKINVSTGRFLPRLFKFIIQIIISLNFVELTQLKSRR